MKDILKIAIGVFIGALAAVFAWQAINAAMLQAALKKADQEMQQSIREQNELQRQQNQAQAERRQQQQRQAQEAAEQQREQMRLNKLRSEQRQEAFKRFYKPTESCKADPIKTECANAFIKANRDFASQYKEQ